MPPPAGPGLSSELDNAWSWDQPAGANTAAKTWDAQDAKRGSAGKRALGCSHIALAAGVWLCTFLATSAVALIREGQQRSRYAAEHAAAASALQIARAEATDATARAAALQASAQTHGSETGRESMAEVFAELSLLKMTACGATTKSEIDSTSEVTNYRRRMAVRNAFL
eukprot:SAG25_NODE_372_length_8977_cov_25.225839_10_plen_169_part_00